MTARRLPSAEWTSPPCGRPHDLRRSVVKLVLGATAALLFACSGCALSYYDYADTCGCPSYGYCPPPPLPYASYCGCPTPRAAHEAKPE